MAAVNGKVVFFNEWMIYIFVRLGWPMPVLFIWPWWNPLPRWKIRGRMATFQTVSGFVWFLIFLVWFVNFYIILGFCLTLSLRRRRQNFWTLFIGRRMMARWNIVRWKKCSDRTAPLPETIHSKQSSLAFSSSRALFRVSITGRNSRSSMQLTKLKQPWLLVGLYLLSQVKHFGFEFNYETNDIDPSLPLQDHPIPPVCKR